MNYITPYEYAKKKNMSIDTVIRRMLKLKDKTATKRVKIERILIREDINL